MSLDTSLASSINAFSVSPYELQALITNAVKQAIEPLVDRVSSLEEKIDHLEEENVALRLKLASLETTQDTLSTNQLIQLRLIREVKEESHKEPSTPSAGVLERVARIEKLCQDAPSHMISLSELRGRLGIDKAVLSRLLKRINQDRFYLRQSKTDKRIKYLCLRPGMRQDS